MKQENFNSGWAALLNAFPNSDRVTEESQALYWAVLKEIPDDIWQDGIKRCLADKVFFPTIHEIGVACFGEQKEEWVDRTDPWRRVQNYREKIIGESWQQRMGAVLESRGLLPSPKGQAAIAGPDSQSKDKKRLQSLIDENDRLKNKLAELVNQNKKLLEHIEFLNKERLEKKNDTSPF